MPWQSYDELLTAAKKWLEATKSDFSSRYEAIEWYINAMMKIIQTGDISVLHRLRKELEAL